MCSNKTDIKKELEMKLKESCHSPDTLLALKVVFSLLTSRQGNKLLAWVKRKIKGGLKHRSFFGGLNINTSLGNWRGQKLYISRLFQTKVSNFLLDHHLPILSVQQTQLRRVSCGNWAQSHKQWWLNHYENHVIPTRWLNRRKAAPRLGCVFEFCRCPCPTLTALEVDSSPPESIRRVKNSQRLKRPPCVGWSPTAGNSQGGPWQSVRLTAHGKRQQATSKGGRRRKRHERVRRLGHLSLSDLGMRSTNGSNKSWSPVRERERENRERVDPGKQTSAGTEQTSIRSMMECFGRKTAAE